MLKDTVLNISCKVLVKSISPIPFLPFLNMTVRTSKILSVAHTVFLLDSVIILTS